ncbi:MAG: hypothetical protein ABI051_10320 [Vicinamibacterales bacterium]
MKNLASAAVIIWIAGAGAVLAQSPAVAPVVVDRVPAISGTAAPIALGSRVGDLVASGYDDGGRRDPFSSLVMPKRASATGGPSSGRPRSGLASLVLADITVRGIVRSGTTMLAILEGPNKQSFVTRAKDRLLDAVVQSIDSQGVVFVEQVDAGMPATPVRKLLRPAGEEVQ